MLARTGARVVGGSADAAAERTGLRRPPVLHRPPPSCTAVTAGLTAYAKGCGGPPELHAKAKTGGYFKCLFTSFVISNMLTELLPPNTVLSVSSALIIRLFVVSCSLFFLM